MSRLGVLLSTGCAVALVAALVPAVASGTNVAPPSASSNISADDRKKPKPSKKPKPTKLPKPSKSPTPSPEPFAPVPIQAKTVGDWVDRQWALVGDVTPRFTYFVEPVLQGGPWEAAAKAGADEAFAIHKALGHPIDRDFEVYMGWNEKWLQENLPPHACSAGNWNRAAQCWGTNVILLYFSSYRDSDPTYSAQSGARPADQLQIAGHIGHELTHMVQENISPRYRERMQLADSYWLVEGWAMVVEVMISARVFNLSYAEARDSRLRDMGNRCLRVDLKDLLDKKHFLACEYVKGMLAMEYLLWKTGDMDAGLTYILQDSLTPREAFRKAFSLDLDAFMEEANAYANQEISLYPLRRNIGEAGSQS